LLSFCYYSNLIYRFCAPQTDIFSFVLFSLFLCPRSQPSFNVVAELPDLYFETQNEKSVILIITNSCLFKRLYPYSHLSVSIAKPLLLLSFMSRFFGAQTDIFSSVLFSSILCPRSRVRDRDWKRATLGSNFQATSPISKSSCKLDLDLDLCPKYRALRVYSLQVRAWDKNREARTS
jgi:hypothetical protein